MAKYIACICEGSTERAIMDLLLDNHMLIFEREELIEGEVLTCRNGKTFEERYLRKGFSENQGFKNQPNGKPSIYCKSVLGYKDVKSYDFVHKYFSDINVLKNALYEYKRLSQIHRGEITLSDLLK